ncbi:MAG: hypothetical protein WCC04_19175 [Terriglobales bacterium]
MNKYTLTAAVIALLGVSPVLAQDVCTRNSQLTPQQRFVQAEIQSRIDESIEAAEANDLPAKVHYFALT